MVSLKKTLQSLLLTTVVAKRKIPISSDCPDETVGFNRERFDEMVEKNKRNPYIEDLDISGVSETMPAILNGSVQSTCEQESARVASGNAMTIAIPAQDEER